MDHSHIDVVSTSNHYDEVIRGIQQIYDQKIKPVELKYKFSDFHSPTLRHSDIHAKPMVLLLGQYSVGKTSFIEYLLERQFPGMRIGPEPTTDRFVAVMKGEEDRVIPGNALAVDAEKPFHALNKYGGNFLSRFEAAECTAPILDHVTFIDTPGVLSGEKQRIGRKYDFEGVVSWFAERADIILLLFDAHKLDISDEFRRTIEILKGHDEKIRVVLNKADAVSSQQLMRVYGAMMWSLGKVVQTPEVMRVYIGSYWHQEYQNKAFAELFKAEQTDLIKDLKALPHNSSIRKINEIVKRARQVKVHAFIVGHLKKQMPVFGKEKKQRQLIQSLEQQFIDIKRINKLPPGDFPPLQKMQKLLQDYKFDKFATFDPKLVAQIDKVLSQELPQLMKAVSPPEEEELNPFASNREEDEWEITPQLLHKYQKTFMKYATDGKMSGSVARVPLMNTGVPKNLLRQVWNLSDIDRDGSLDLDEFAVAMFLCQKVKKGKPLPAVLPSRLIPPSKK